MGKTKTWKPENTRKLKALIDADKNIYEIAVAMNMTEDAVRMRMSREGLYKKKKDYGHSELDKKHKDDISTRIRILRGEEIRTTNQLCFFTDEQLSSFFDGQTTGDIKTKKPNVSGCVKFCLDVLAVELQDYQIDIIDKMLNHKRFVGVLGRQSGKDFLLSCFAVWISIIKQSKLLLVSAGQRQSDLLYDRILRFIGSSNELFDSVDKSNAETCKFKNGSEIWSLSATGFIRGQSEVDYVIVNEAFEVPDECFSSVEPMLAIKNGFLYIFSTPRGCVGRLYDAFNSPFFEKVQLASTCNKYISSEYFDTQQKTMDSLEYDMEINAQFQENVDAFFSLSLVNNCSYEYQLTNYPEPDKLYYLGIDWGRVVDSSVFTIVSKKEVSSGLFEYKVENIIELVNKPFPEQIALIKKINDVYHFRKIVTEYCGLGIPPSDELKSLGMNTEFFQPTLDNQEKAYNNLRKLMENKQIVIPKHQKLQSELRTFQYEMTNTGKMKFFQTARNSSDFCDSLAWAIYGASKKQGVYGFIAT